MTSDEQVAPLTFGQLSTLRYEHTIPVARRPDFHLMRIWPLPEDTTPDRLDRALTALARRHESLRTYIGSAGPAPRQIVRPARDLHAEVVRRPAPSYADAQEVVARLNARPFDFATEFGWRYAAVADDAGRPRYAAIAFHHMAADRWSLGVLEADFAAILAADGAGGLDPAPQPRDMAALQRSDRWQARRTGAERYWDRLLHDLPSAADQPRPPAADPTDGKADRVRVVMESPTLPVALAELARRWEVSGQSTVLALTCLAVRKLPYMLEAPLMLMSNNRFEPRWRGLVSSLNQTIPFLVRTESDGEGFEAYARRVHWASRTAFRHGFYDVDELAARSAARRGAPIGNDYLFNYLAEDSVGRAPVTSLPRGRSTVATERSDRQAGPLFALTVTGGDRFALDLRADPRAVPEPVLLALVAWCDEELCRLAEGATSRVGDMLARLTW